MYDSRHIINTPLSQGLFPNRQQHLKTTVTINHINIIIVALW